MSSPQPLLDVRDVRVAFGGVNALNGVSFAIQEREICGLIGPNGAGKTTLFNCITRLHDLAGGEIAFAGANISRTRKRDVVRLGIARTFQNLGVYPRMSVLDNVHIGMHHRRRDGFFTPLCRPAFAAAEERRAIEWCRDILSALDMEALAEQPAGSLPYGTLQRLELARAVAASPRLLLLDEPAAGQTLGDIAAFGTLLRRLHQRFSLTILLVEHNMRLVMNVCEHIVVMDLGRKLAEGTPAEIQQDAAVVSAYLGRPQA